ncbi:hypothetical protein V6N13_018940 [Hibiscus sabdariffa]
MTFFGVIWSNWLLPNEVVFNSVSSVETKCYEILIVRLSWWVKAKWPCILQAIFYFDQNSIIFALAGFDPISPSVQNFPPSPIGSLNFYVDGAISGHFGVVGIGGALTYHSCKPLITFSKSAGCVDVPITKVFVVREACFLFAAYPNFSGSKLVIGCDCSNVVNWYSHPPSTPSFIKATVVEYAKVCSQLDWKVVLIPRTQNVLDDFLVKKGVN